MPSGAGSLPVRTCLPTCPAFSAFMPDVSLHPDDAPKREAQQKLQEGHANPISWAPAHEDREKAVEGRVPEANLPGGSPLRHSVCV